MDNLNRQKIASNRKHCTVQIWLRAFTKPQYRKTSKHQNSSGNNVTVHIATYVYNGFKLSIYIISCCSSIKEIFPFCGYNVDFSSYLCKMSLNWPKVGKTCSFTKSKISQKIICCPLQLRWSPCLVQMCLGKLYTCVSKIIMFWQLSKISANILLTSSRQVCNLLVNKSYPNGMFPTNMKDLVQVVLQQYFALYIYIYIFLSL